MKIAAVSDDGVTISQHFGRAPFYIVLTVENGEIVGREKRNKMGHAHGAGEAHNHEGGGRGHGFDPASQSRHDQMIAPISDCAVLLARGMGAGAYESIRRAGVRPLLTEVAEIEAAVRGYLAGTLVDHVERLH